MPSWRKTIKRRACLPEGRARAGTGRAAQDLRRAAPHRAEKQSGGVWEKPCWARVSSPKPYAINPDARKEKCRDETAPREMSRNRSGLWNYAIGNDHGKRQENEHAAEEQLASKPKSLVRSVHEGAPFMPRPHTGRRSRAAGRPTDIVWQCGYYHESTPSNPFHSLRLRMT